MLSAPVRTATPFFTDIPATHLTKISYESCVPLKTSYICPYFLSLNIFSKMSSSKYGVSLKIDSYIVSNTYLISPTTPRGIVRRIVKDQSQSTTVLKNK